MPAALLRKPASWPACCQLCGPWLARTCSASHLAHQCTQIGEQEAGASEDEAFINFTVTSRPNAPGSQGKPADTQKERSHFVKEGGKWLYFDYK